MMNTAEPNLVYSSKGQAVLIDGCRFQIEIYRLEHEEFWTLEVVDHEGIRHVWEDTFSTDIAALEAALKEIQDVGAAAFIRGNNSDNVVPFRHPSDDD